MLFTPAAIQIMIKKNKIDFLNCVTSFDFFRHSEMEVISEITKDPFTSKRLTSSAAFAQR